MARGPKGGPQKVVVGIDQSLASTGIVVLTEHGDIIEQKRIKPTISGARRLTEIHNSVLFCLMGLNQPIGHVCMEGYGYGTVMAHKLGECGGAIKMAILQALGDDNPVAYPTYPVPSQVKKWATGSGVGEKSDIKLAVYKRWGVTIKSNDVADAYVLARIALSLMTGEVTTKYEQEVITALHRPDKHGHAAFHAEMPDLMHYAAL